ncbi:hypothetical protein JXA88_02905 [Candidatus Fermentibacteria bacterium]|nr:hypothetical protein [Candidatus Fermentibacteria bacterium]
MADDNAAIHQVSHFLAALAHACETNLGRSSLSLSVLAGKKFGREAVQASEQTTDPFRAVEILRDALTARGIMWDFAPFAGDKGTVFEEDGKKRIRLEFHTCMVRNALFRYAHDQKLSLCYMSHGVFAGAMERVMPNTTVHLEIIHAGPNACLKDLIWEDAS